MSFVSLFAAISYHHYYNNFALEYAFRMVHGNQLGLKLNGTYQLLFYANDVNLLWEDINTTEKSTVTLTDAL
jgi:hypothetical protein